MAAARVTLKATMMAACAAVAEGKAAGGDEEARRQCDLLREIFGLPMQSVQIHSSWFRWRDGAVVKLAQDIYDCRRFGDLPLLANELEQAGCRDRGCRR